MNKREFLLLAAGATILPRTVSAQGATVPFPTELGLPPIEIPPPLRGNSWLFPIPAGYFVRLRVGIFCEDRKVTRDLQSQQFSQDGKLILQAVSLRYTNPNQTGMTKEGFFAAISTPSWLTSSYSRTSPVDDVYFRVIDNGEVVTHFRSVGEREAKFYAAYSKTPALLRGPAWAPPW